MANGTSTKSLWNYVTMGVGIAIGVVLVNGALSMLRNFTGFPPAEFSLPS